jgi:hypothetical protein
MSTSAGTPTTLVFVDQDGTEKVVGHVDAARPDLALVDALARLQLVARGRGRRLCLRDPTAELCCLLSLVGLADALGVEPRRQAELGEELGGDEVVQPGDPPA